MSFSKTKGTGFETEIVRAHQKLGIEAKRSPYSGALKEYPGDVQIAGLIGECKRRRKGYSSLYKALDQGCGADMLFIRDDRKPTMVVLPWGSWELILKWLDLAKKFPHIAEIEAHEMGNEEEKEWN